MNRTRKLVRSATVGIASIGLAAVTLSGATTASAGSNGNKLKVHTTYADQIQLEGYNQHGDKVTTRWIATPDAWTWVHGWWWKGNVKVKGTGIYKGKKVSKTVTCFVPGEAADDWINCRAL
ncbi:hypothetical protein AB0A69_26005 [Streptomyces sp. NPDC045431]|uniref:hypothetical protein n=1 Tax=Streptomyces sp. NPDC045431 TaxID=3155613 RepID=UPI0033F1F62B